MIVNISCFILLAVATAVSAAYLKEVSELELQAHNEVKALFDVLKQAKRAEAGKISSLRHDRQKISYVTLGTFSYSNCANPNSENVVPSNISIAPDPIKIPGIIVGSGSVIVKTPFGSPVKTQMDVWKEVLGTWVKVPCIDQFGSCNYEDFCTILNPPTCPPELVKIGLNCKCPFTAGSWNVPPFPVNVTASLPFPISGGVKAQVTATYNGNLVTCVQVQFDLA